MEYEDHSQHNIPMINVIQPIRESQRAFLQAQTHSGEAY